MTSGEAPSKRRRLSSNEYSLRSAPTDQATRRRFENLRGCNTASPSVFGNVALVYVGKLRTKFWVHEDALRKTSGFFDAALKGYWRESRRHEVSLLEEDEGKFQVYVQWLYAGRVNYPVGIGPEPTAVYGILMELYAMGGRLQDSEFQDAVITCIMGELVDPDQAASNRFPSLENIQYAYNVTLPDDPLRTLITDFALNNGVNSEEFFDIYPTEFLVEIAETTLSQDTKRANFNFVRNLRNACRYHQHKPGDECKIAELLTGSGR